MTSATRTALNAEPRPELERNLIAIAETALVHATELGATTAAVDLAQEQGIEVTVRNGKVETVEHNRDKSLVVTVYFGHQSGTASTTDFSMPAIRQSVTAACDIAKFTEQDECNGLADSDLLATDFPDLDLFYPWQLSMQHAIEIATDCEGAALRYDKRISNSEGATVSSHQGVDLYANSQGFRGLSRASQHSIGCSVIAGEGAAMQRDYWYDVARNATDLRTARHIGKQSARRAVRRIGARKARTGEYPIIFEPAIATSLLSHLISAISGANLYRKSSFLLDKAGQRIFPEFIRIHEQPYLPKSPGGASFDREGVATRTRDIVTDGVLQGYVLNSYSARKLNTHTTGNAGGVRNLQIDATTEGNLESLIQQMGRGLVVSELIGFGVNTVTGDYSRGAFGFWVEHGEIQYPLQEFTIAGNLSQMFDGIVAVGTDTELRGNIRTGSILLEKMTVAGE